MVFPAPAGWLFFGLTGAVGRAVQALHQPADPPWHALSRQAITPAATGVQWWSGRMPDRVPWAALPGINAIASLGPLDVFARWFAAAECRPARVVALGSTSIHTKRDSPDPAERALAIRLREAEDLLVASCRARGVPLLLLRPTLIYGMGGDRSLSRLVALARRWRCLPISTRAVGLRMPVHAADLAAALLAALRRDLPLEGVYAAPGGEVLTFRAMLERTLAAAVPGAVVVPLPDPLFRTALWLAWRAGLIAGASAGMLSRLDQDLVADATPLKQVLDYQPRVFSPRADMFTGGVAPKTED